MAEGGEVPEYVLQLLADSDADDIDIDLGTIFSRNRDGMSFVDLRYTCIYELRQPLPTLA